MMDLGEPFKCWMTIEPALDGSFIVNVAGPDGYTGRDRRFAFTTIDDLLIWMAKHGAKARVTELSEGDVVRETYAFQKPHSVQSQSLPVRMPDGQAGFSGDGIRRTTAAEIIAEREYRNTARAAAAEKHAAQRNAPVFGNAQSDAAEAWPGADKPTNAA